MEYIAGYLNKTTLNQALKLLRDLFGQSYYGADDKYIQWQYFDSPFKTDIAGKDDYSILVFLDKDRNILALDAFLPWPAIVNGKEVVAVWDIEWINFSKIRGLGRELIKLLRENTEIYCGYGMNQLSSCSYEKLGYSMKEEIERKITIMDAEKCIELFGNEKIKGQREFFMQSEMNDTLSDIKYFVIESADRISERYWLNHIERFAVTSFKDIVSLKWRYLEHPYIDYRFIALDPEAKMGLAVVRVEKIKYHNENVLRILELFPISGYERDLANAVLKFGLGQGGILADFFCVSKKYCDEICPAPFVSLSEHRQYEVPMLFQPIEVRERKSINMVLDCNQQYSAVSFDNFYATKGDGDQDVFVNYDYKTISL